MWKTFRKVCSEWRDSIELARPAPPSPLWPCCWLPSLLRSTRSTGRGRIWRSLGAKKYPGGTIRIAVEGAGTAAYTAYLPGLSNTRLRLTYDARTFTPDASKCQQEHQVGTHGSSDQQCKPRGRPSGAVVAKCEDAPLTLTTEISFPPDPDACT